MDKQLLAEAPAIARSAAIGLSLFRIVILLVCRSAYFMACDVRSVDECLVTAAGRRRACKAWVSFQPPAYFCLACWSDTDGKIITIFER